MHGGVGLQILKRDAWVPEPLQQRFNPKSELGKYVRECLAYLPAHMAAELIERISRSVILESALGLVHWRLTERGIQVPEDHGIVSQKVVTTAGVNFLVDAWEATATLNNMKYHGIGVGVTAEAIGDTALVTESTTALNPDSTRATGTTVDGGSANILVSVGTLTADAAIAATEHGLFSQAAVPGGTLWDRSLFTVVNLANGDSLQATYSLTCSAGG